MNISNLPLVTTIAPSDLIVCNAIISGVETTVLINGTNLKTALGIGAPGSVVALKSVTINANVSIASGTWTDVSGLSITYTPTSASNNIFVMASVQAGSVPLTNGAGIRLVRNSTPIGVGTGVADVVGADATASDAFYLFSLSSQVLDSPATTSSTTYKVQAWCLGAGSININVSSGGQVGGASTLTIMEVVP